MSDRYKRFAQFLLDYLNIKVKLDKVDFELLERRFREAEYERDKKSANKEDSPGLMFISWNVADYFGLDSLLIIEGKGRKKELTQPRQICYYIANKIFGYTFQSIGDFFGGDTKKGTKNHATILSGVKRTQNLMDTEKDYNELVYKIIDKIKNGSSNKRTNTTTGTQSVYGSSESEGNNLSLNGNGEIQSSDRLLQGEYKHQINIDHITENQPEGELEKRAS